MCTLYVYTYHRTYVIACDIYIYILFLHMHTHIHTPEYTLTQAELNLRCTCNLWRGHMAYMASLWAPFLFCFLACGFVFPAGFSSPQVPGAEKEGSVSSKCPAQLLREQSQGSLWGRKELQGKRQPSVYTLSFVVWGVWSLLFIPTATRSDHLTESVYAQMSLIPWVKQAAPATEIPF